MNYATASLGASIVEVSSEAPLVVSRAENVLNDQEDLLWLSGALPQHIVIRMPEHPPIRYLGWHVWHDYLTNPRTVEVYAGPSESNMGLLMVCTALAGAGVQLWELKEPIPSSHYCVKFRVTASFGPPETYMNRIFLFADHPGPGFTNRPPAATADAAHAAPAAPTSPSRGPPPGAAPGGGGPTSPNQMASLLRDLDQEIRMLHPLRNVSPARQESRLHSTSGGGPDPTLPLPAASPTQEAQQLRTGAALYNAERPPFSSAASPSSAARQRVAAAAAGGGLGYYGYGAPTAALTGGVASPSGPPEASAIFSHDDGGSHSHQRRSRRHSDRGATSDRDGDLAGQWGARASSARLQTLEAAVLQLTQAMDDQRKEIGSLRELVASSAALQRQALQQQQQQSMRLTSVNGVINAASGGAAAAIPFPEDALRNYVEDVLAPKLAKHSRRVEERVLSQLDDHVQAIVKEVSAVVDERVRRHLHNIAVDPTHPYHYRFADPPLPPTRTSATSSSAANCRSQLVPETAAQKGHSKVAGSSNSDLPTSVLRTRHMVPSTHYGSGMGLSAGGVAH